MSQSFQQGWVLNYLALKEKTMKPEEVIVELQKAFELSKEMPWSQDYLGFKRQLEEKMKNKGV